MLLKRPWMQLINMIQKNNFWAAWGWWPHAARYTLEIFRYIVSAWQRTASQVCRGWWGTGKACHQQSHVLAASPEQYQKKQKKRGAKLLLQLRGIRVGIHASAVLPRVISRASGNSHVFALSVIFYGISTWGFRFGGFCLYFFFETNACTRTWKLNTMNHLWHTPTCILQAICVS